MATLGSSKLLRVMFMLNTQKTGVRGCEFAWTAVFRYICECLPSSPPPPPPSHGMAHGGGAPASNTRKTPPLQLYYFAPCLRQNGTPSL